MLLLLLSTYFEKKERKRKNNEIKAGLTYKIVKNWRKLVISKKGIYVIQCFFISIVTIKKLLADFRISFSFYIIIFNKNPSYSRTPYIRKSSTFCFLIQCFQSQLDFFWSLNLSTTKEKSLILGHKFYYMLKLNLNVKK